MRPSVGCRRLCPWNVAFWSYYIWLLNYFYAPVHSEPKPGVIPTVEHDSNFHMAGELLRTRDLEIKMLYVCGGGWSRHSCRMSL